MRRLSKKSSAVSVLLCALLTVAMVFAATGPAKAHHVEGVVYCDDNESRAIEPGIDSVLEGVCVNVVNTDTLTDEGTDCTDSNGEYYESLPSTKPANYKAMLVSGLPLNPTFIIPATNEHPFVMEDGHTDERFDWLIDSAICHSCGDGFLNEDEGETCDPPDSIPDGSYPENECREDCTYCGDGILQDEVEECDFMELDIVDCDADCTWSGGDEGCTPGYWKQEHHFDSWVGYVPGYPGDAPVPSLFSDAFGIVIEIKWKDPEGRGKPRPTGDPTLLQALEANGGGINELARHGAAALLSAAHPDVAYPYAVGDVIEFVKAGETKKLVDANELGCPLNGKLSDAVDSEDAEKLVDANELGRPLNGELSDDIDLDQLRSIAACGTTVSVPGNPKAINLGCLVMVFGAVVLWKRSGRRR